MMRLFLSAALIGTVFCSSCMTLDSETSKPSSQTKPMTRVTAFAKQWSNDLAELTREVVPVVQSMNNEVSSQLRADWTRIREELSSQMSRPLPSRKNPSAPQRE